jgi:lysophospholipase L1-like esterase
MSINHVRRRFALAGIVAAIGIAPTPVHADGARVGIWGPAVVKDIAVVNGAAETFTNQTIRNVVYASAGGTAPRVRVSNWGGDSPLTVGYVDLAEQSLGGIAVSGSHHRLTFGGAGTVTIPAHGEVFSDPAVMTIVAGENLLISVYVPGTKVVPTYHPISRMNTYVSNAGNFAADDASTNYPGRSYSWYFLSGLDVVSPTAGGTVVAFGDSLTDGVASTTLTNRRYPDYLARRLWNETGGAPAVGIVNTGLAGNAMEHESTTGAHEADRPKGVNRFAHDALGFPGVKAVILFEGINDITYDTPAGGTPVTSWTLRADDQALITQAHNAGVKVYGATLTPFKGFVSYTAAREATRQALNTWIRTSGAFDGVIDFDAAVRDPSDPSSINSVYAHTDHLHFNDDGDKALADAIDLAMIAS